MNLTSPIDCSSPEAAAASLTESLGIEDPRGEAVEFCRLVPYGLADPEGRTRGAVFLERLQQRGLRVPDQLNARWYHATRVFGDTTFADGLLPLSDALPKAWANIERVARRRCSEQDWQSFRNISPAPHPLTSRLHLGPVAAGPYAFLVRSDAIDGEESGHRRFLKYLPEAIDDICRRFDETQPLAWLHDACIAATTPVLVSFVRPCTGSEVLKGALGYIEAVFDRRCPHVHCFYQGNGRRIPPSELTLEWFTDDGLRSGRTAPSTSCNPPQA